jgi:hypothetical protein
MDLHEEIGPEWLSSHCILQPGKAFCIAGTELTLDAAGPPTAAQKFMRHADIRTTTIVYGDVITVVMAVGWESGAVGTQTHVWSGRSLGFGGSVCKSTHRQHRKCRPIPIYSRAGTLGDGEEGARASGDD